VNLINGRCIDNVYLRHTIDFLLLKYNLMFLESELVILQVLNLIGMLFQISIAVNEMSSLPILVLTFDLYKLLFFEYLVLYLCTSLAYLNIDLKMPGIAPICHKCMNFNICKL